MSTRRIGMNIIKDKCTACGKCVNNCYRGAIRKDADGKYVVDPATCDDCTMLSEPFCARSCTDQAVDGGCLYAGVLSRDLDPRPRIRVSNLQYFVGAMGFEGVEYYRNRMDLIRITHAKAYVNPNLEIVIARGLDDFCWGCPRKKEQEHMDANVESDVNTEALTGLKPNQAIRYWDALKMCKEKLSPEVFRTKTNIEEQYIKVYEAALKGG